jgi:hypothetical protein
MLPVNGEEFDEDAIEAPSKIVTSKSGYLIMEEERDSILAVKYKLTDDLAKLEADIDGHIRFEDVSPFYDFKKFKDGKFYGFKFRSIDYSSLDISNLCVYDLRLKELDTISLRMPDGFSDTEMVILLALQYLQGI